MFHNVYSANFYFFAHSTDFVFAFAIFFEGIKFIDTVPTFVGNAGLAPFPPSVRYCFLFR